MHPLASHNTEMPYRRRWPLALLGGGSAKVVIGCLIGAPCGQWVMLAGAVAVLAGGTWIESIE